MRGITVKGDVSQFIKKREIVPYNSKVTIASASDLCTQLCSVHSARWLTPLSISEVLHTCITLYIDQISEIKLCFLFR